MADEKNTKPMDYEVTHAREIGGVHRVVGAIVPLTPAQAKYYLSPYGVGLKPVGVQKPEPLKSYKSNKVEG